MARWGKSIAAFLRSFPAVLFLALVYILQAHSGPQLRSLFFLSLFIPQVLFPSHDNFEVSTRVLVLLHSFLLPVCVLPSRETEMCTPLHVHVCLIKISQASFFPCRQPLTISSSAFSSLHSVILALNKSRSSWTLTCAFACANTRADVMRVCTPSNMVPIMCLSFSKLERYQL